MVLIMVELFFNAHPERYDGEISLTIVKKITDLLQVDYDAIILEMMKWVSENLDDNCQIDGICTRTINKQRSIEYNFRFRNKSDALLFKLVWGGE
jgi:hypothetical protein